MSIQFATTADRLAAPPVAAFAGHPWLAMAAARGAGHEGWPVAARKVAQFGQDREIYGEGDKADTYFGVRSGVVRTRKFLADGRRQIDAFYVAGDVFGLEAEPHYRLSAEAVSDCALTVYRRRGLDELAAADGALSQRLLSYAMHGMARAQDHAQLLGRCGAVERVAAFLMEWARHFPGDGTITLAMTRQDMADYLGLTIETVSRTLSLLERDAIIDRPTSRQIRLRDPAALRHLHS